MCCARSAHVHRVCSAALRALVAIRQRRSGPLDTGSWQPHRHGPSQDKERHNRPKPAPSLAHVSRSSLPEVTRPRSRYRPCLPAHLNMAAAALARALRAPAWALEAPLSTHLAGATPCASCWSMQQAARAPQGGPALARRMCTQPGKRKAEVPTESPGALVSGRVKLPWLRRAKQCWQPCACTPHLTSAATTLPMRILSTHACTRRVSEKTDRAALTPMERATRHTARTRADVERAELMKKAAESATASMFPWERKQMDGSGKPLSRFDKFYWAAFGGAILFLVGVNGRRWWLSKQQPKACPVYFTRCLLAHRGPLHARRQRRR